MTSMRDMLEEKYRECCGKPGCYKKGQKGMGGEGRAPARCYQDGGLHRRFRIARAKRRDPISRNKINIKIL